MSYVDSNEIKIGESATQSQNFKIRTNNDGTFTILRADGSQNILSCDANGVLTSHQGLITGRMVLGTAVPYTSFTTTTYHDFTGIPSWVKKITITLDAISSSSTSNWFIQLGTSAGIETTSYVGSNTFLQSAAANTQNNNTTGFVIGNFGGSFGHYGSIVLMKHSNTIWTCNISVGSNTPGVTLVSGSKTMTGGTLDRVRLVPANGTDTFDNGTLNIMYEG